MKKLLLTRAAAGLLAAVMLLETVYSSEIVWAADSEIAYSEEDFLRGGTGKGLIEEDTAMAPNIALEHRINRANSISLNSASDSDMTISDAGVELVKQFEGIYLDKDNMAYTYDDLQPNVILKEDTKIKGTLTIGYGHTNYAGPIDGKYIKWDTKITLKKATEVLKSDMGKFGGYVNTFMKNDGVSLNQDQFDALTCFTYNVGNGVWNKTTTIRTMLDNGIENYSNDEVINAFSLWNKCGGVILAGLTRRRRKEAALFLGDPSLAEYKTGNYKVASSTLYVRTGPGSKYAYVQKDGKDLAYKQDVEVKITEIGNTYWGKCEDGWIQLDYCRYVIGSGSSDPKDPSDPTTPTEDPEEVTYNKGYYMVTAEALTIRKGAGTSYASLGEYSKGKVVKITETSGRWGKCTDGWISLKYCTKVEVEAPTANKISNVEKGICLSWKAAKDVKGYYLYKSVNDKWVKLKSFSSSDKLTYTDSDVKNGDKCQYKIVSYKKYNKDKDTAECETPLLMTYYRLDKVTTNGITTPAKGQIKFKWKKNSKCSGYQIEYANNREMKNSKKVTVKKAKTVTKLVKNLPSKARTYFRMRAYKSVSGVKYYSEWFSPRYITVK